MTKLGLLAQVLWRDPGEFFGRLLTFAEFHADRLRRRASMPVTPKDEFMTRLEQALNVSLKPFLNEPALRTLEQQIAESQARLTGGAGPLHDATFDLARTCYAVCRALNPEVVVETGVGNGVTTAFLLQALAANGKGELWSIDLPPLGSRAAGLLVPDNLKTRWHLLRGRSRRILPELLRQLGRVDLFLHDSLHTYRNMSFEFHSAWAAQAEAILSDDVQLSRAFEDFARQAKPALAGACERFGVVVRGR